MRCVSCGLAIGTAISPQKTFMSIRSNSAGMVKMSLTDGEDVGCRRDVSLTRPGDDTHSVHSTGTTKKTRRRAALWKRCRERKASIQFICCVNIYIIQNNIVTIYLKILGVVSTWRAKLFTPDARSRLWVDNIASHSCNVLQLNIVWYAAVVHSVTMRRSFIRPGHGPQRCTMEPASSRWWTSCARSWSWCTISWMIQNKTLKYAKVENQWNGTQLRLSLDWANALNGIRWNSDHALSIWLFSGEWWKRNSGIMWHHA